MRWKISKTCSMCGRMKPDDQFNGTGYYCKPCRNDYERKRKADKAKGSSQRFR